jgi:hypothetical protein
MEERAQVARTQHGGLKDAIAGARDEPDGALQALPDNHLQRLM